MDELYSAEEVSKILRMTKYTIRKKLRLGEIRGIKVGRDWRIPKSEIQKLIGGI